MNDLLLIERIRGKDRYAADELIRRHQNFALRVAFRYLKDEEDAIDAAQDAFIKVFKSIDKFSSNSRFTTWLYSIIQNICIDRIRQKKRRDSKQEEIFESEITEATECLELSMEKRDTRERILNAAEGLHPKQKETFFLRDIDNLSVEETAEIMNISTGAVKSNLYHARKFLREALSEQLSVEAL